MKQVNKKWLKYLGQIAIAGILVGVYFFLSQAEETPVNIHGTYVGKNANLDKYELIDHDNKPFYLSDLDDRWIVLFFGFTHCPDVCPTTLAYLKREFAELKELQKYVQVVMVSVDPKRDRPSELKNYVKGFDNTFIGATGREVNLKPLVKTFGGFYHYHQIDSAVEYTVEHPGDIFLISPTGEWHALYRPPLEYGILSDDLRTLILRMTL